MIIMTQCLTTLLATKVNIHTGSIMDLILMDITIQNIMIESIMRIDLLNTTTLLTCSLPQQSLHRNQQLNPSLLHFHQRSSLPFQHPRQLNQLQLPCQPQNQLCQLQNQICHPSQRMNSMETKNSLMYHLALHMSTIFPTAIGTSSTLRLSMELINCILTNISPHQATTTS